MKKILFIVFFTVIQIHGQNKINGLKNTGFCNPVTGMCETSPHKIKKTKTTLKQKKNKKVKLIYFTDPICSNCWGIEPQIRKLESTYGQDIEFEYRMGGLLLNWSYFKSKKPSDLAPLWNSKNQEYKMPIDGDIWLEDPVDSSYPPSIAIKAAQLQSKDKSLKLLRELREMVFVRKQNIGEWKNIVTAAKNVGLDVKKLKSNYQDVGKILFNQDLALTKQFNVNGFPTIFFISATNNTTKTVFGRNSYLAYEKALLEVAPNIKKTNYKKDWKSLFSKYSSLTLREFSLLSKQNKEQSEKILNQLTQEQKLKKFTIKNGSIWSLP